MIRHFMAAFASQISVDEETGSLSVFNTIDEIQIELDAPPELPIVVPFKCVLVNVWGLSNPSEPFDGEQRIRLLGPSQEVLGTFVGEIGIREFHRGRHVGRFERLRLAGSGRHEWEVSFRASPDQDWTVVASLPVDVEIVVG